MSKDGVLHEAEETCDYALLVIELLDDELHLIVLRALMILLILLILSSSSLGLHHVGLVLVLLQLILDDALLNLFEGLSACLLLGNAIVADHVNEHNASVHNGFLLVHEELDILAHLLAASLSIGVHHLSKGCDEELNAFEGQV